MPLPTRLLAHAESHPDIAADLREAAGMVRWVPVTERLPWHGETVLIGWATGKPRAAMAIYLRGKWRDPNRYSKDEEWYRPTHWRRLDMPLPSPPKDPQ